MRAPRAGMRMALMDASTAQAEKQPLLVGERQDPIAVAILRAGPKSSPSPRAGRWRLEREPDRGRERVVILAAPRAQRGRGAPCRPARGTCCAA